MDRMNMRVVREMIFFDQTFFLVGLSSGTKLRGKLSSFLFFLKLTFSRSFLHVYLLLFKQQQRAPGRRSSRLLATRATTHEIRLEHSENHKGDEDGRRVSIETSPR